MKANVTQKEKNERRLEDFARFCGVYYASGMAAEWVIKLAVWVAIVIFLGRYLCA